MAHSTPITGKHVLFAIVVFFAIIFAANAVFITLALQSFPGETEKHAYVQGLRYNEVLAEREAQAALGWRAEVSRVERAGDGAIIELRLYDAAGQVLSGLRIEGALRRPVQDHEDTALVFTSTPGGAYRAAAALTPGVWDLTAEAASENGAKLNIAARIIVE